MPTDIPAKTAWTVPCIFEQTLVSNSIVAPVGVLAKDLVLYFPSSRVCREFFSNQNDFHEAQILEECDDLHLPNVA